MGSTPGLTVGNLANHAPGLRTYIAQLDGHPDFAPEALMPRGSDRKQTTYGALLSTNSRAMEQAGPALEHLREQGLVASYEVHPVSNSLVIDVPEGHAAEAWKALNAVPAMGRIVRNPLFFPEIQALVFEGLASACET